MPASIQYASFLVRLWRFDGCKNAQVRWQCEVKHLQSGELWHFQTLPELEAFLHQRASQPGGLAWTDAQAVES